MNLASQGKFSFGWLVLGLNLFCLLLLLSLTWYGYRQLLTIADGYQKLNAARIEVAERSREEDLLRATTAERAALQDSIVSEDRLPGAIDDLERLGDQIGAEVKISNVSPGDENNANIKLALTANGAYRELMQLTTLVENFPYQLKIVRSDFRRFGPAERKGPPAWQVRLDLELLQPQKT